ncbi:hypothetical protein IFM89_017781 [Coptis chinensis]|uniref:Uncharacterized protein n=1 Tax=Coptis chinensis TaxID=261450 RepID=A0A835I4U3_9MAGN|nr:hypothetical protein IFM89_017781 [Coptis chinensis]
MQRRVAGMLTILDDVKHRIQKSQSSGKKREAQLNSVDASLILSLLVCSRTRNHQNQYWMRSRSYKMSSAIAQLLEKSLEKMFSSLGKEKSIMLAELAKIVEELSSMEEQFNDRTNLRF